VLKYNNAIEDRKYMISLAQRRKDKSLPQFSFPELVIRSDSSITILLVISAFIVSISVFFTFVGTSASASTSDFTINIPPGNTTDESGTNSSEIEPPQGLTPSDSLTLKGISPQGESDLSIACSLSPERC
jgi:hypothetical protein